jgi:hypothetical protein
VRTIAQALPADISSSANFKNIEKPTAKKPETKKYISTNTLKTLKLVLH